MSKWLHNQGLSILPGRIRFHRNGVAGEGFHTVEFKMREGRGMRSFVGIVFDEKYRTAVIDPTTPSETWRGDNFDPMLREAIARDEALPNPQAYIANKVSA